MKNKLLIFLTVSLISLTLVSQKSQILEDHYKNEWKTFKEFVRYSEDIIPDTSIDVKFYYLDLEIAIDSPYIAGIVTCVFESKVPYIEEVWLSLNSSLHVNNVSGDVSDFLQTGDSILITLDAVYGMGDVMEVVIDYEGIPVEAGGYKGLRYETHHGDEPIIATLSTPYLAHYWYPCKDGPSDKPDSVYVDITIPIKYYNDLEVIAVSNGLLENVIDNGSTKTYQWRHRYPVVPYYVMVAISNFVLFGEEYTGIYGETYPLDYYVFEQDLATSQAGVEDMPLAMDVFSELFGEYPFSSEKYGMTQLGYYGAIENQTNTITNNMSSGWFYVSVHELGHMWFGDMITCENWHHAWLNEGFATYSEALYDEAVFGYQEYKDNIAANEYFSGGTVYLQNATDTFNVFQNIIYRKGAYVLHMLRGVLGDSVFLDCIYDYSTDPEFMYKDAITEDFQTLCEEVSGEELDYFFDQWIYDEYYPIYYYNFENLGGEFAFVIKQVQGDQGRRPVFEMPVEVKLMYESGGDTIVRVWNDEEYQVFTFPTTETISMIEIDPETWILCKSYYHPEIPVGVGEDEIDQQLAVNVYPNPISESATIEILSNNKNVKFVLYDLNGKEVLSLHDLHSGSYPLDRGDLPGGIYFYSIHTIQGDVLASGKLIFK